MREKLLEYLKTEANSQGIIRLSLRDIAKNFPVSYQTIKVVIGELENLGEISVDRKHHRNIITIL